MWTPTVSVNREGSKCNCVKPAVALSTGGAASGMLMKCCGVNLGGPVVYRCCRHRNREPQGYGMSGGESDHVIVPLKRSNARRGKDVADTSCAENGMGLNTESGVRRWDTEPIS
jgi:hypothetical protein